MGAHPPSREFCPQHLPAPENALPPANPRQFIDMDPPKKCRKSSNLDPPKGILFKPLLEKAPFAHQERFLQVEAFLEIPWFGDLEPFISSWNM